MEIFISAVVGYFCGVASTLTVDGFRTRHRKKAEYAKKVAERLEDIKRLSAFYDAVPPPVGQRPFDLPETYEMHPKRIALKAPRKRSR